MACEGARRSRRCTLNIEVVFDNPWQRKQRPTQILIHSMSPTVFYGFVLLVLKYQTLTCSDYVSAKLSGLGGGVEVQCVPFLVACAEPLAKPCYYSRFFLVVNADVAQVFPFWVYEGPACGTSGVCTLSAILLCLMVS